MFTYKYYYTCVFLYLLIHNLYCKCEFKSEKNKYHAASKKINLPLDIYNKSVVVTRQSRFRIQANLQYANNLRVSQ